MKLTATAAACKCTCGPGGVGMVEQGVLRARSEREHASGNDAAEPGRVESVPPETGR